MVRPVVAAVGTGSSIHPDIVDFLDRYRAADFYRSNDCSSCSGGRKAPYCCPMEPCLGHTAVRPGDPSMEAYNAEVGLAIRWRYRAEAMDLRESFLAVT
jgi:hypothetical protein